MDKFMHVEQITQNNLIVCLHMHKWCKESWSNITYASVSFFFSVRTSAEQGNYSFTRLKCNVANIFIMDSYDPLFSPNDSFSELNSILQKLKNVIQSSFLV